MSSKKIMLATAVGFLLFALPVRAGAEEIIPADVKVQKEFQSALKENKEFAEIQAKSDTLRKELEALQEKLAGDNSELKKMLEEQKKLRNEISAGGSRISPVQAMRMFTIDKTLNRAFANSKEYAELSLRFETVMAETYYVMQKILDSSADPRMVKYNDFVQKFTDASFANAIKNAPKAKVEGSEEYKAAMYGAEKYKKDPARNKWAMVQWYSALWWKLGRVAEKDPAIREMGKKLALMTAELQWKRCLLQEKNPELAWKLKTTQAALDYKDMESMKKYNELNNEWNQVLRSGYAKLEKESQELRQAQMKAVEDFAAKSDAPEAIEYRKVKALMDEANQKVPSGKAK